MGGGIELFNTLKKALSRNVCFAFSDEYKINMNSFSWSHILIDYKMYIQVHYSNENLRARCVKKIFQIRKW